MKSVFITGAAGFIGSYVVRRFVAAGWHVVALVHRRSTPELDDLAQRGAVTLIRGDVGCAATFWPALAAAASGTAPDVVVHCAGRASDVGWTSEFRKTNYASVGALVQWVRMQNVGRFVFVSTTDVYGLRDFHGESEDDLPLGEYPRNPYPRFKIAAEQLIRTELPADRFCIVRPAQVWGVGDRTLTSRIVDFLRWSPWIIHFGKWRGRNRWPLAHVRNVAETIFLAATLPAAAGGTVNVVDDERTTIDEFYRILARVYLPHKRHRTITLPFWFGQCIGGFVSGISNLFNLKQPFMDPSFYALYAVSRNLDFGNRRMQEWFRESGSVPVTREQGLRELETEHSVAV